MESNDREGPPPAEASGRYQEARSRFVLFWGEMATNWGINRTMAQIHALLYVSEEPLDTDEIMERLQISRGNANMNLRSLTNWNLVRKVHLPGSRKDFYAAEKDVWEITKHIVQERQRREIQPVMEQLEECRALLNPAEAPLTAEEQQLRERIDSLIELIEMFEGFFRTLLPMIQERNAPMIRRLMRMADALTPEPADKGGEGA